MLQSESFQFDFPTPPSLAEFVFALLLTWSIALTFMAVGLYAFHRNRNIWIKLASLLAATLGVAFCFLLGLSFTPINHHRYGWSSTDREINNWINFVVVLIIWVSSSLLFWIVRKVAKRGSQQMESNEN